MPIRRHFRKYERWVDHRRKYVGASESPILLGYGYSGSSELGLYAAKIEGEQGDAAFPEEVLERMRLALAVEKGLIELLSEQLGVTIKVQGRTTYIHDQHQFIGATPDGLITGDKAYGNAQIPVEIKNVGKWMTGDWSDGKTPVRFLIQLQHQIAVMGATHGYIAANLANEKLVHRKVERDNELIELMVEEIHAFWDRVTAKVPPSPDETSACRDAIHRMYPLSDPAKAVELPIEAVALLEEREQLKEQEKEAKAGYTRIENLFKAAMGQAQYAMLPDAQIVKWATEHVTGKDCPKCGEPVTKSFDKRPFRVTKTLPAQERLDYVQAIAVPGLTAPSPDADGDAAERIGESSV